MLSKNKIKYIRSLHRKKYRDVHDSYIVEGEKLANEILRYAKANVLEIFAMESWIQQNTALLKSCDERLHSVNEKELKQISQLSTPNQVLITATKSQNNAEMPHINSYMLYLDGIRDPGNMGTILRTADWFGHKYIFCSADCVEVYNNKVLQASMGAFLRVHCISTSLEKLKREQSDAVVYGATLNGTSIGETDIKQPAIFVIGSESHGISTDSMQQIDTEITIPSHPNSKMESLNAAIASGIFLYEMKRNWGS